MPINYQKAKWNINFTQFFATRKKVVQWNIDLLPQYIASTRPWTLDSDLSRMTVIVLVYFCSSFTIICLLFQNGHVGIMMEGGPPIRNQCQLFIDQSWFFVLSWPSILDPDTCDPDPWTCSKWPATVATESWPSIKNECQSIIDQSSEGLSVIACTNESRNTEIQKYRYTDIQNRNAARINANRSLTNQTKVCHW